VVAHVKVGLELGSHTPAVFNTVVRFFCVNSLRFCRPCMKLDETWKGLQNFRGRGFAIGSSKAKSMRDMRARGGSP
jgi:hypothetical protein